jgi:hypothetical protein
VISLLKVDSRKPVLKLLDYRTKVALESGADVQWRESTSRSMALGLGCSETSATPASRMVSRDGVSMRRLRVSETLVRICSVLHTTTS